MDLGDVLAGTRVSLSFGGNRLFRGFELKQFLYLRYQSLKEISYGGQPGSEC